MATSLNTSKKRREWVNREFASKVSGTHMSNSKKSKLLKKLWREAKRNIR